MKSQINTLRQLQELVLTRDEHNQTGDGSHLDSLNESIAELQKKLDSLEPDSETQYTGLREQVDNLIHSLFSMRVPPKHPF